MRRVIGFSCAGDRLFGTVDEAAGAVGVLIVSGGNEIRCGAHRGMAQLAQRLAARGVPVFRFDRRGVGDSDGENRGYAASAPDIAAALAAFRRAQPHVARVVGFGNCDAATALALHDHDFDALVLANPWLGDEDAPLPPSALRAHYVRRLFDPAAWHRLFSGGVSARFGGLAAAFGKRREQPLAERLAAALATRPAAIVLASGDRTAQVFAAALPLPAHSIATASHSFADAGDALEAVIHAAVDRLHDKSCSDASRRIQSSAASFPDRAE